MTEFSRDQDELASAYLDDDVTLDERALVEGDPQLLARVDELRAVRDALAAPVAPPDTAARDAAISAALDASNVVSLDAARGRRRMRIASIAAAVLVVLGAAGVLIRSADKDQDTFQTVAGGVGGSSASPTAEATPPAAAAADALGGARAAITREALGSFADRAALANAAQSDVHSRLDQTKTAAGSPTTVADGGTTGFGSESAQALSNCAVPSPPDAADEVYAATAVLEGRPVQVDVFTIVDGSLLLVVTDSATCMQVFTQPV